MHSVKTLLVSLAIAFSAAACAGSGSVPLAHTFQHGKFKAVAAQMENHADRQYWSDLDRIQRARHHHATPQCVPSASPVRNTSSSRAS